MSVRRKRNAPEKSTRCWPFTSTNRGAAGAGANQNAYLRDLATSAEEGGGTVRRTEEPDRLRRLRLRRMKFVREQFFLAATAQNIKRLVRFLSQAPSPTPATTA